MILFRSLALTVISPNVSARSISMQTSPNSGNERVFTPVSLFVDKTADILMLPVFTR